MTACCEKTAMSESANYCDDLYMSSTQLLAHDAKLNSGIHLNYGIHLYESKVHIMDQMRFFFCIEDSIIKEVILDMTGCIDADAGEY